jgi:D-xylose transport system substrate-binding protein
MRYGIGKFGYPPATTFLTIVFMHKIRVFFLLTMLLATVGASAQKVGLLLDSYFIDRWYTDQKLLSEKIKQLGGECIVEVPHGDPVEQVRLGKKLIADKVDVLIIIPTDSKKAIEIVEAAAASKIPVLVYDRFINSKDVAFYISYNNNLVGRLQALYAMNRVPSGNYLLVNGPVSDNNAILFREGQLARLKPSLDAGKVRIIGDIVLEEWSEMEAMMKVDEFMSSAKVKPDVIIAANDAIATGSLQALPPELLGKVVVTGQDAELLAIKNIIKGHQAMTIYKPIRPLAEQAAEIAMKLAKGETVHGSTKFKSGDIVVEAILLDPVIVEVSNYEQTVIKDGHISLNENKKEAKK